MSLGLRSQVLCLGAALVAAVVGCSGDELAGPDAGSLPGPAADVPASELARADGAAAAEASAVVADGRADALAPPGAPAAGCHSDNDCQLVSDCCSCEAIPRGENPATCDPNRSCVMSVCAQYKGVDRARCSAGRCVLGFECDTSKVLCKRLPPVCPQGQVPQVVNSCYGECVDARQCLTVPACTACRSSDLCVRAVAASGGLHCQAPVMTNLREM